MMYKYFLLLLLSCFSLCAYAAISVSPITVDLIGKDADAEIAVKNIDTKNNAYVEITPYRLLKPADRSAPKKKLHHPDQDGLIVFPAKLVLLPGQTQFVRLIKTAKSLTSDQVYEVDFIPKVTTHLINQKGPDGIALGIKVIVGYGARVTLRPDSPAPALSVQRTNNQLIIKNTGNTLLNITSCTQQLANKKTEISLPAYTIFAGQTIKKELSKPSKVIVDAAFMGKPLGPIYTV